MKVVNKQGDFTGLANDYSLNRPDYSESVLKALVGLIGKEPQNIYMADVGAGTGIWSRMAYQFGIKSLICIEPNQDMRNNGIRDSKDTKIKWREGSAEETGLEDGSVDFLTMASSFHWAKFDLSLKEFHRVLKPEGLFCALWNPRLIEVNPLLVEIEEYLNSLKPNIKRVSSGRSGITQTLTNDLEASKLFKDVIYMEGRHVINMTKERYIGAWRSVNDLQVQLGKDNFIKFLNFVEKKICNLDSIEATYLTRAWSVRKSN